MVEVSVISTVYDGAPFFARVGPSILGQTMADFEWVIVDDGSTDETPDLLAGLARRDPRIVVVSPGRLGRSAALNLAVETARGRFIVQQDFDDLSYSERIERQVAYLRENPAVGLVGSYYVLVDEIRGERYVRQPPTQHAAIVRAMARNIPFAHTVVTYRKEAWREAGRYPATSAMIDFRMFIEMARRGWELANIPQVLGEHFVYGESYWHKQHAYKRTQQELIGLQLQAIRKLRLPLWTAVYPAGRLLYRYLPTSGKRFARRRLAGSQEVDL